jgi:hypothetical protein
MLFSAAHIVGSLLLVGHVLAQATQWPLHDNGLNQVIEWYGIVTNTFGS